MAKTKSTAAKKKRTGMARTKAKPTAKKKLAGMARTKAKPPLRKNAAGVTLLSGGNPQIAMGDGDAPVQAYIAALPGWKSPLAKRLDALIVRTVPTVTKAVKWNSPMYGMPGQGFFVSMHAFTRYLKLTFFRGASLDPLPPGTSTQEAVRYLDITEGMTLDERQLASWFTQAAALPGWIPGQR